MNQKNSNVFNNLRFGAILLAIILLSIATSAGIIYGGTKALAIRYANYMTLGNEQMDAQDYTAAIGAFEDAYRIEQTDEAAIGLAKAWFAEGDAEKAIQVLSARTKLYPYNAEVEALLTEYNISIGIYPTVVIGGEEIETNTTAIFLNDVTLTEEDKQALADFTDLVTLELTNCGLTDVEFLRNCNKLMSVTLTKNPISDFSPLQGKPDLRTVYLNDTAITDYTQLHSLTSVTTLNINGNWITVEQLNGLKAALPGAEIYAGGRFLISTITIAGMTFQSNVTELDLSNKGITDVTPLQQFTNLQKLNLSGNKINWITPMDKLTTLTWLDLSGNRISNISALSAMTGLTYLNLEENAVTDISPLASMSQLTELNLKGNTLYHGHDTLSKLTALETLNLQDANWQDKYLNLIPMDHMTTLDLRNNPQLTEAAVQEFVAAHSACSILHDFGSGDIQLGQRSYPATDSQLDASYSSVVDLTPLEQFTHVTNLNLAGNGISDFSPLKTMTKLTGLNLKATGFSDCSVLSGLTELTELTLSGNPNVTDIIPLISCTKLTTLALDGTGVTDVSPLTNMPALSTLHLDGCAIQDYSQLHRLTGLKSLYIIDCGITADELSALQQALPNCTVYAGDVTTASPTP